MTASLFIGPDQGWAEYFRHIEISAIKPRHELGSSSFMFSSVQLARIYKAHVLANDSHEGARSRGLIAMRVP